MNHLNIAWLCQFRYPAYAHYGRFGLKAEVWKVIVMKYYYCLVLIDKVFRNLLKDCCWLLSKYYIIMFLKSYCFQLRGILNTFNQTRTLLRIPMQLKQELILIDPGNSTLTPSTYPIHRINQKYLSKFQTQTLALSQHVLETSLNLQAICVQKYVSPVITVCCQTLELILTLT